MMTLRKAFLSGYVSPTLLSLWSDFDEKGKPQNDMVEHMKGSYILNLTLVAFGLPVSWMMFKIADGEAKTLIEILALLISFSSFFFFTFGIIFRPWAWNYFTRDCKILSERFDWPRVGYADRNDLYERVTNHLKVKAQGIAHIQSVSPSDRHISKSREEFGSMFDIAKKFNLTAEDWHPYFDPNWNGKLPKAGKVTS